MATLPGLKSYQDSKRSSLIFPILYQDFSLAQRRVFVVKVTNFLFSFFSRRVFRGDFQVQLQCYPSVWLSAGGQSFYDPTQSQFIPFCLLLSKAESVLSSRAQPTKVCYRIGDLSWHRHHIFTNSAGMYLQTPLGLREFFTLGQWNRFKQSKPF